MKLKILALVIISLIVFTACSLGSKQTKIITEADLRHGTSGLVFNFLQGTPPDKMYESSPNSDEGTFPVAVLLENQGTGTITNGFLNLGYETNYLSLVQGSWYLNDIAVPVDFSTIRFILEGKSLENTVGGKSSVYLQMKTGMLDPQSQSKTSAVTMTACYDYETKATVPVCIDTDPYNLKKGVKACTIKDAVFTDQGAPLAITKVETKSLPQAGGSAKLEFYITIENKGLGEVVSLVDPLGDLKTKEVRILETPYMETLKKACSPKIILEELDSDKKATYLKNLWNIVGLKVQLSTDEEDKFDCSPQPIRLIDKKAVVRCVYSGFIQPNTDYMTVLNIFLKYGYTHTITKSIEIQKNPSIQK